MFLFYVTALKGDKAKLQDLLTSKENENKNLLNKIDGELTSITLLMMRPFQFHELDSNILPHVTQERSFTHNCHNVPNGELFLTCFTNASVRRLMLEFLT